MTLTGENVTIYFHLHIVCVSCNVGRILIFFSPNFAAELSLYSGIIAMKDIADTSKVMALVTYVLLEQLKSVLFCSTSSVQNASRSFPPPSFQWRSPEEYYDELLTEKIDVFSLGNNIYGVLTGMMPFHEETTPGVQYLVGQGERPFIDPRYKERSLAEVKLVEIIESCHEYYEQDRPSIFEVVDFLRHALQEVNDAMGNKNL